MIWVVSDTHLTKSQILPEAFTRRVNREDVILHLGDIISLEVIEYLQALCRVEAVRGNCDMPDLRRSLPVTKTLELDGRRIGLVHGRGGVSETLKFVKDTFQDGVDIALFGHTHIPFHAKEGSTLYFNPGSLHNGRAGVRSFGILHLSSEPWGELVEI